VELITGLAQTFITDISLTDIENYWLFLRPYSLADFEKAVVNYCISPEGHRFMPKPGELIAALEGNALQQAQQAWTKVMNAIRRIGGDKTLVFDDALIHAIIDDMGGWVRLCELQIKDEPFKQREFEGRYVNYRRNPPTRYPRQLIGRMGAGNLARCNAGDDWPRIVGDEKKALAVYKAGQDTTTLSSYKTLPLSQLKALTSSETSEDDS
jgi:hypothetical protein